MGVERGFGRGWRPIGRALVILGVLLCCQANAAPQDNESASGSGVSATSTQAASAQPQGAPAANVRVQETRVIDGHALINLGDLLREPGSPREKFRKLHEERLWAVAELDQQRAELNRLLGEAHRRPIPVPVVTESDYNARVADLDTKIRLYESQQNNTDLTETQRSDAHAQLIDLTRQKARAALELITYHQNQQEMSAFNDAKTREDTARSITTETLSYLTRIDDSISDLMMSSHDESSFRLWMGAGFVALVTLLIGCFFMFGSRSGSMKDMFKNDRGLQFITLFSLVIAITMFGLLNILEGKELSALLGGLSGYILGRSNLGRGDDGRAHEAGGAET